MLLDKTVHELVFLGDAFSVLAKSDGQTVKFFTECNFIQRLGSAYALISLKIFFPSEIEFYNIILVLNDTCKFSWPSRQLKPEKL